MMRLCALARAEELAGVVAGLEGTGSSDLIRPAELGLVMLRGRIGGEGAPFNLGEATAVRAAVQNPSGVRGFAYHLGRDKEKARLAALIDAAWQEPSTRRAVEAGLAAVGERLATAADDDAARTAATRVNFFTLARGED